MTPRKASGATTKKATAKSSAAKSTTTTKAGKSTATRSAARTPLRGVERPAKKAAPMPPTAMKQRPDISLNRPGGGVIEAKVKTPTPYEVRVGGTVVPIVPFRIESLIQYVGSVTEVAGLLGVAKSQPTRWRKGEAVPSPEKARLLNDLEHVYSRAAMIFEPDVIRDWMTGPNRYLGGRPIDVLRERGASEVLDALDAAEQIAFGG
jgi:hypothetical protein